MSQCTAKSVRSGKPCRAPAIQGGTVCQAHGGSAPQVRNAAARRVAHLVDPAIDRLEKALKSKNDAVALRAAQDILDRNGLKGDTVVKLLMPEGGLPVGLTDEQAARIRSLPPDKLVVFDDILAYIETGEWADGLSPGEVN